MNQITNLVSVFLLILRIINGFKVLMETDRVNILQPESCEFDSMKQSWYFSNQINSTIQKYSSQGLMMDSNMIFKHADLNTPAGIEVWLDTLFVASFGNGNIVVFNTTNGNHISTWSIGNHNPNGLCLDSDNMILYVTDVGLDVVNFTSMTHNNGMWAINLMDATMWTVFNYTYPDNNNTRNLYPNGCVYNSDDQMVYVCQTNLGTFGGNNKLFTVEYTPSGDQMFDVKLASGGLSNWDTTADGILFDGDGNLYVTSWGQFSAGTGYINVYDTMNMTWSTAIPGLSGPADIGYDYNNSRICIPNYIGNLGMVTNISDVSSMPTTSTSGGTTTTNGATTTMGGATTTTKAAESQGYLLLSSYSCFIIAFILSFIFYV
jgi:hypothetical protein